MILPNVRAAFGSAELAFLLDVLDDGTASAREKLLRRVGEEGLDRVLDDPRTLDAVVGAGGISAAPLGLFCYLLVRRALLDVGIHDHTIADYLAALLTDFGRSGHRASEAKLHEYLVDVVAEIDQSDRGRAFELHAYLGDYSLWLSGLFPERVVARVHRRGAPGLGYYEEMGSAGYRTAARYRQAGDLGLEHLYRECADRFTELRVALNAVSDRYLFPTDAPPVDRLLRQVADSFRLNG